MREKKRRSSPEIRRALDAQPAGAPIEDLEYEEVTGLLDAVLAKTREATETSTSKVRQVARKLEEFCADGPPTTPQRRPV